MKGITEYINEQLGLGVMNHYTPISNIIINVRNLYAHLLSILVEEDLYGTGIILKSSRFTNLEEASKILYGTELYGNYSSSLAAYITSQGLNDIEYIQKPREVEVWFKATDIYKQQCCAEPVKCPSA